MLLERDKDKQHSAKERIDYILEHHPEIADIIKYICNYYNVSVEEMQSKSRYEECVNTRHIISYVLSTIYHKKISLRDIGLFIGGKNHASVIHGIRAIKDFMDVDKNFKKNILLILQHINNTMPIPDYSFSRIETANKLSEAYKENIELMEAAKKVIKDFKTLKSILVASENIEKRIKELLNKINESYQ